MITDATSLHAGTIRQNYEAAKGYVSVLGMTAAQRLITVIFCVLSSTAVSLLLDPSAVDRRLRGMANDWEYMDTVDDDDLGCLYG
jgi:hypothetical protein